MRLEYTQTLTVGNAHHTANCGHCPPYSFNLTNHFLTLTPIPYSKGVDRYSGLRKLRFRLNVTPNPVFLEIYQPTDRSQLS